MSLSIDLVYLAPKLRVLYSTCLTEKNIQDLLSTNSAEDYFDILKETTYYQYVKGISPKDILGFELSLDTYLYNLAKSFERLSEDTKTLIDSMRKISIAKIYSVIIRELISRDITRLRDVAEVLPQDVRGVIEEILREELTLPRILENIKREGLLTFEYYFREFTRSIPSDLATIYSLDLSIMNLLYNVAVEYPETQSMICPDVDQYLLNFISKIAYRGLRDKLEGILPRIQIFSCNFTKEVISEMLDSDETRLLAILRRFYPPTLLSHDLVDSIVSIRGYLRKIARRNGVVAMSSYPFTYSQLWAVYLIKKLDVEDLVSILIGKVGLLPLERIRRSLSV